MVVETKKIMGDPAIEVAATCVRVPVLRCHGEAINVEFAGEVTVEAARAAVHVPSGAIAGLDGIRAMREMGLDAVTLTTVKHPRSLGQMPPLSELIPPTAEEALIMSPEARLLFSGTAEEAIRRFPANVNVAVSLGLAGLGFSRTRVRLFADPCAAGTLHHISARAGDCTLETMTRPAPLPQNPRSSALAMYSVPALLRGLAANPKLAG